MSKIDVLSTIHVNTAVEGTVGSRVWMISWNFNGSLLASCGDDKTVRIWKKVKSSPYLECCTKIDDSHSKAVRCVEFSHCEMSKIDVLSTIHVNTAVEGTVGSRVWMISWNFNGSLLASCGDDKTVRIWKKVKSSPYLECCTKIDDSHSKAVRCVEFSHCGRHLASASFDASVVVYSREEGEFSESDKLEGHESEVKWCSFSPSDEFLATCSRDRSVWFWQMDEDEEFQVSSVLQSHTQDVKFVAWHPHEELLVSCSYDSCIIFYRFDGDDWITQQKICEAHYGTVWCAAFDSDGHRLVTVGEDHVVNLWKRDSPEGPAVTDKWRSIAKLFVEDTELPLYTISWHKITGLIASGGGDGIIRIFRVEGSEDDEHIIQTISMDTNANEINCVAWNPTTTSEDNTDSWMLASCSDDGTIRLFGVSL
ncbi:WD domain, G-beta repeat protein [Dictyocaulus viviparus]|uniref:Probable cytosolic iron-sulfur protein assembly protein CIAO1 homolog n=1 Tax=Dictyocaulus viviparus TaxID=29172 RepID=A0A0D8Y2Z3_DICVI|nr:WD domain, G-beta repeat protein [Dictyocaulus viviparus]